MNEELEVLLERRDGEDYGKKILDGFWVSGPEPNDLWKSEPDPDPYYTMSDQAVFYKEKSNDSFLLYSRERWCPAKPNVIGACSNEEKANILLYENARDYAQDLAKRFRINLRDLAKEHDVIK